MKSILFIHQSAELYGSDKTILMFISSLDKQKYKSIVVLPFDGPLKREFEKNGIEVVIAPVLKLYRKMFTPTNILKFFKEYKEGLKTLNKLHKKHNFNIVYSHTLAALIGIVFAKKNNIKHLWHVQEIIAKPVIFNKGFVKLLSIKANDVAVYDSRTTMEFWIKNNPRLAKKSEFVCNGLDVKQKPEPNIEKSLKIRNDYFKVNQNELVIALVGRINSWKGQQLLLEAFNKITQKYDNIKLVYLGSAPPNQEFFEIDLKNKISEYGLNERVIIIPFQENIWPFWDSIDIAVVPSTEPEPFGMVAIEAMLSKKPVVAANHGGLTETVLHNHNGLLFEPNNAESLAISLEELINDESKRKQFGENGYHRTIEHFSLEKHVEKFEAIFEKI
ncbi:glycosyltransferase family 4 protein [Flavobacterium dankookense]|uniref:Glycosyltransferase involved in cell wall biosynthesis n=1 Tax=Flavobacterium dankookense TaxID=706186 RepID=A0A4R6QBE7_9FLAO|nr:glycosyltransferase family 4 protein [Flavobacterium dankookense]TDP60024.1 glycosyltransferase involved in cell wall biosynthesis [Flavobacterium dankookense]